MDVSLIICTRNRCTQLARCLDSVKQIEFDRPWELILVDNGSVDETAAVVHKFIDECQILVTHLSEKKSGKSNALNAALRMSRGKILAFTDDDCYPKPDFLACIWAAFEDPSVGYITGRIMLHDPADARMTINESTEPLTFPGNSLIGSGTISGANMAFRHEVLRDIDGFDPFFGPGSPYLAIAEDLDVAGRASARGWKGEYRPEIVVSHHHGRKVSDIPSLVKGYGIGIGAFHMKLLLDGREFSCFARSIWQVRRRFRRSRRSVLWEPVGAARYARNWLRELVNVHRPSNRETRAAD
jgi:cellulose synthase/poly-beta-1,6-N-acetylglucosamine synthase-like glycosyltransferase